MILEVTPSPAPKPIPSDGLLSDLYHGLDQRPRTLPSKYLYDARGSELFAEICELPEYYLTRSDIALTRQYAPEISAQMGSRARLVELGVGEGTKTEILLESLQNLHSYLPIDISAAPLKRCVGRLRRRFPDLSIHPLRADYTKALSLPRDRRHGRTLFYYPGSTIGNFHPPQAREFLARIADLAGPRGAMLVAVDLAKDAPILEAAYNDAAGVTAQFNLNLIDRINRELDLDLDRQAFFHHAVYRPEQMRVEMQLISRRKQRIELPKGEFSLHEGEPIITEFCYKYSIEGFASLAEQARWRTRSLWIDQQHRFSLWMLEHAPLQ